MTTLYSPALRALAADGRALPSLAPGPGVSAQHSPYCGDEARAITPNGGAPRVWAAGCAVCHATAAAVQRTLDTDGLAAAVAAGNALHMALQDESAPWPTALAALEPARAHPDRHGCVTLVFSALAAAMQPAAKPASPAQHAPPANHAAPPAVSPAPMTGPTAAQRSGRGAPSQADPVATGARWAAQGRPFAVATLVEANGAAPCPVGSRLVIDADGRFAGSVSGGCVEGAVLRAARDLLEVDGPAAPVHMHFAAQSGDAWSAGLPCGSALTVLLERGTAAELRALAPVSGQVSPDRVVLRSRARGFIAVLDAPGGHMDATSLTRALAPLEVSAAPSGALADAVQHALHTAAPATVNVPRDSGSEADTLYIEPRTHEPRVFLVGAVHIAQHLAELLPRFGLAPVVVDPRPAYAEGTGALRFPPGVLRPGGLDDTMADIGPRDACVVLAHNTTVDDAGLRHALAAGAFYVGALGSRKSQARRLSRLSDVDPSDRARIHGPVGLSIGAVGPAEIALSIAAELVKARRLPAPPAIGAVVLAAGNSSRMGAVDKLLLDIGGEPLVARAARAALDAGLHPVVVVTRDAAVTDAVSHLPVRVVHNPRAHAGMGTSLAAGIDALERGAGGHRPAPAGHLSGAVVLLADMPGITEAHLRALTAAHTPATRGRILVSTQDAARGTYRGPPVLFGARYFDALRALTGDRGGRDIIAQHPGAVTPVVLPSEPNTDGLVLDAHADIDTPADAAAAGLTAPGAHEREREGLSR